MQRERAVRCSGWREQDPPVGPEREVAAAVEARPDPAWAPPPRSARAAPWPDPEGAGPGHARSSPPPAQTRRERRERLVGDAGADLTERGSRSWSTPVVIWGAMQTRPPAARRSRPATRVVTRGDREARRARRADLGHQPRAGDAPPPRRRRRTRRRRGRRRAPCRRGRRTRSPRSRRCRARRRLGETLAQQRVPTDAAGAVGPAAREPGELDSRPRSHCGRSRRPRVEPLHPAEAKEAHLAAAMVRGRKKWWLPATKRAGVLAAERRERRREVAEQQVARRLAAHVQLVAHVQALGGEVEHVDRALAGRGGAASRGPTGRRGRTPGARARRVAAPNQSVLPGPSFRVEKARDRSRPRPPRPASTASTRRSSARRGVLVAGSQRDLAARDAPRRAARSVAQPSNTPPPVSARRCGSQTRSHSIGGPECSSNLRASPGPPSPRARQSPPAAPSPRSPPPHARSRRRSHRRAAPQSGSAAPRSGSPPAGGRQSTSTTDAPCARSASANVESPTLTAATARRPVGHTRRPDA